MPKTTDDENQLLRKEALRRMRELQIADWAIEEFEQRYITNISDDGTMRWPTLKETGIIRDFRRKTDVLSTT